MSKKNNFYLISFIVIVLSALVLQILKPRNYWACEDGEWLAIGNPKKERPNKVCLSEAFYEEDLFNTIEANSPYNMQEENEEEMELRARLIIEDIDPDAKSLDISGVKESEVDKGDGDFLEHENLNEFSLAKVDLDFLQIDELISSPYLLAGSIESELNHIFRVFLISESNDLLFYKELKLEAGTEQDLYIFKESLEFEIDKDISAKLIISQDDGDYKNLEIIFEKDLDLKSNIWKEE